MVEETINYVLQLGLIAVLGYVALVVISSIIWTPIMIKVFGGSFKDIGLQRTALAFAVLMVGFTVTGVVILNLMLITVMLFIRMDD